jgi:hypothetical protein
MPSKIVCGVKEPKGKERRGTMLECAEKKQIRYYGLKKVDKVLIDKLVNKTKEEKKEKKLSLSEAIGKMNGIKTRITKTEKLLESARKKKETDKIKMYEKEIEESKKEFRKTMEMAKKLQEEENNKNKKKSTKKHK